MATPIRNKLYKGVLDAFKLRVGGETPFEIDNNGFAKPITSTDAAAPNNSIYYSSTQSKLVYKDGGGTVNNLY